MSEWPNFTPAPRAHPVVATIDGIYPISFARVSKSTDGAVILSTRDRYNVGFVQLDDAAVDALIVALNVARGK